MPEQDDLYVAFHALQQGDVTREQLLDALYTMAQDRISGMPVRALGTILVQKRHLPQMRLREILTANAMPGLIPEEATRSDSIKLGQLLAMSGVVTYGQIMEALLQQEVGREHGQQRMRLGEYLVSMGYTTPHAIQRALSYQRKAVYACTKCLARFNIVNAQAQQVYQCVRCQGQLRTETENVRVDESAIVEALQEGPLPPPMTPLPLEPDSFPIERVQEDRVLAQYLSANRLVPEKSLLDAAHWQIELAQFGLHAPLADVLRKVHALSPEALEKIKSARLSSPVDGRLAIPGYRVTGLVTSGSTAAIYSAQSQFTPGAVGLKILHVDVSTNETQVARFRQDASMLIRFDHPGIVKGYEYGSVALAKPPGAALHYLRMEDVHGTTLDHLISVKGKLSPSRAVPLTIDIAQALRYLEKEGFVNGDLRAEHILVDPRNRGRLLDVGSARPLDSGGRDPRVAVDVFSLGKLLRGMLTGSLVDSEKPGSDLGSVSVSAALLSVIRSMLHPDPARRFQHFGDVVAVLQAATEPAAI